MKAHLNSVRLAPKKANLIARLVRGQPVKEAILGLSRTNKKGARIIEKLLRSAVANAEHNDKQNAENLVVRTIVVNQGAALRRGVPMARGRTRPIAKFLTHISIALGVADEETTKTKKKASASSKKAKVPVQKKATKEDSSESSASSAS